MEYRVKDNVRIEVNDEILNFLGTNDNVMLSEISNSDKVYMIYLLKQYYLELRKKLGLDGDITFGLEMEFEEAMITVIEKHLDYFLGNDGWIMVPDGSLSNGAEINSPVLNDSEKTWIDLSLACNIVNGNAYVMDNTSAHIHIGTQILGNNPKYWRNFALLWATYENVIFRFLYGEYISPRSTIEGYAMPVSSDFISKRDRIEGRSKMINASNMFKLFDSGEENVKIRRRKSVNFTNVSKLAPYIYNKKYDMNTVEFRSANGTFDPIIWQNNVNFLVKLMLYCKSDKFNEKEIIRTMNLMIANDIPSNLYKYSRIYVEQAIELADMIFDNNIDKIYFLRQYIKDGQVSSNPLTKSKQFTRR